MLRYQVEIHSKQRGAKQLNLEALIGKGSRLDYDQYRENSRKRLKTRYQGLKPHHVNLYELAAVVANHLKQHGIKVVLVGGLAVKIYSENLYLTKDIDMVNTRYELPS